MSLGVLMKDLADRGGAGWRERKRERERADGEERMEEREQWI